MILVLVLAEVLDLILAVVLVLGVAPKRVDFSYKLLCKNAFLEGWQGSPPFWVSAKPLKNLGENLEP